jgi:hypothetical protein
MFALASKPCKKRPRTLISSERKECSESDRVRPCGGPQYRCGSNWNHVLPESFSDKACKKAKSASSDKECGAYQSKPIANAKQYCQGDAGDGARDVVEASPIAPVGPFEDTKDETTHHDALDKGSPIASLGSRLQDKTVNDEEDGIEPSSIAPVGLLEEGLMEGTHKDAFDKRLVNESLHFGGQDDTVDVMEPSSIAGSTRLTHSDSLDKDSAIELLNLGELDDIEDDEGDSTKPSLVAPLGPLKVGLTEATHSDSLDKVSADESLGFEGQEDAVNQIEIHEAGMTEAAPSDTLDNVSANAPTAQIELREEGRTEAAHSNSHDNVSADASFGFEKQDNTAVSCLAAGEKLCSLQSVNDQINEMQKTIHYPGTSPADRTKARCPAPGSPSVRVDQVESAYALEANAPIASDDRSDILVDAENTFYIPDKSSTVKSNTHCSTILGAKSVHVDQVVSALPAEASVPPDSPYVSTLPPDSSSSCSDSSVDTLRNDGRVEYAKAILEKSAELRSVAGDDILAEFVPSAALRTAAMAMKDFSFEFEGKGSRAKPLTLKDLNDSNKVKRSTRLRSSSDSFGPLKSQPVAALQARTHRDPSNFVSPNPTVQGLIGVMGDNTPALRSLVSPPTTKPLKLIPKSADPFTLQTLKLAKDTSKKRRITFDGKPGESSKKTKYVPSDDPFDYTDDAERVDAFADKDDVPRPDATRVPTIR